MRGSGGGAGPVRSPRAGGSNGSRLGGAGKALHAKTFAVDGRRLFVGSFNFDPRSARLNTELGLVIDSARLAGRLHSALASRAPAQTYEVRLSDAGEVYWIDRRNGKEIRHDTEPGTTRWQRAAVALLSWLPIDWLL
jgi:putative cardiolipin synthase